ncbi:hypothetical protein F4775DRAFT_105978 [Biscogniauxia sp. FL1348]|nr:hypothetical protein F4775DRAFT_105978 [Biscogniauxia sp. FL1348]
MQTMYPQHSSVPTPGASGCLLFRCPYHVYMGDAYYCNVYKRIADIRTHVRRSHYQKDHCPTCARSFEGKNSLAERDAHIREGSCEYLGDFTYPGATYTQIKAMDKAAENRDKKTPLQKWNEMREILLPRTREAKFEDICAPVSGTEFSIHVHDVIEGYLKTAEMVQFLNTIVAAEMNETQRQDMIEYLKGYSIELLRNSFYPYVFRHEMHIEHTKQCRRPPPKSDKAHREK